MELTLLADNASKCKLCAIHKGKNKSVFSRGSVESGIMICGMCPGPKENEVGIPFIGPAGKILDILIEKTIKNEPYITNLVKCFVPPGIKLKEEWMLNCLPYFINQIILIKPKVIIALGTDVASFLTGQEVSIGKLRNKEFFYMNSSIVCTYHPSYYARGGGEKHKNFIKGIEDFNRALNIYNNK